MDAKRFNKLIARIATDNSALEEIYSFYYDRIVFHLSCYYDNEISKDATHELFMRLIQGKIHGRDIRYPTAWMFKCAENIAKAYACVENKSVEYNDALCGEYLDAELSLDNIEYYIEELDAIDKKIIRLYYVAGYSLKEISIVLKLSYPNVRQRHRRAIKKMRKRISNYK